METTREVTREEFYNFIGPKDAILHIENVYSYPYTTLWRLRYSNKIIGKTIDEFSNGMQNHYPIITKYYLLK